MRRRIRGFLVCAALILAAVPCAAGPYGDALAKCLVSSTTSQEKTTLVRWMFAMMSLHPDVEGSSSVTPQQRTAVSKETAQLFQKLVTETCVSQTVEAIKYEGASTLETSFSLLGQVAARELFAHPRVTEGMAEFGSYLEEDKIKGLLDPGSEDR